MSLQSERIQLLMQRLSLTEMVHGYEALAEQAAQKNLPYCDFLEQVLESEANVRQERNIKVRTQLVPNCINQRILVWGPSGEPRPLSIRTAQLSCCRL